jgi:folate-binding protein YgfZ
VTTYFANLAARGVLQVTGPEAIKFLQGQTTCDLEQLQGDAAMAGAYCTPQGRMVCDFRILASAEETYLLQMHGSICDPSMSVFGKYIVFSKAEIANVSPDWQQFAVWGESAAGELGAEDAAVNQLWTENDCLWLRTEAKQPRFEVCVPAAQANAFAGDLAGRFQARDESDWQLQEIDAGIGHVEAGTFESFLPQMLNYQLTDRVSFTKGCYTGQEVVARMHYRGKLKRAMYLASVAGTDAPTAGTALFRPGREQSVGNVVNAASAADSTRLLAVVTSAAIEGGIHLASPDGPTLEFLALPYSLDA